MVLSKCGKANFRSDEKVLKKKKYIQKGQKNNAVLAFDGCQIEGATIINPDVIMKECETEVLKVLNLNIQLKKKPFNDAIRKKY